jgi:hypothetical protein
VAQAFGIARAQAAFFALDNHPSDLAVRVRASGDRIHVRVVEDVGVRAARCDELVARQIKAIPDVRPLSTVQGSLSRRI